jgi:hypothetical protein
MEEVNVRISNGKACISDDDDGAGSRGVSFRRA